MLGHTSSETTEIYTHVFDDDKRNLLDEAFKGSKAHYALLPFLFAARYSFLVNEQRILSLTVVIEIKPIMTNAYAIFKTKETVKG